MDELEIMRDRVYKMLGMIQETELEIAKIKLGKNEDVESILLDMSYDIIYSVMEMIDGYTSKDINIDLIDKVTKRSLREGCELHDMCANYLKS